jgi:hypothetical protein
LPTPVGDFAVAHSSDRCSPLGDEVYSTVGTLDLENRVKTAIGEGGADAAELDRVREKGAGKRPPFEIVVAALAIFILKIKGKVFLPSVDQFRGQDAKGFLFLASLPILPLEENPEGISLS